MGEEIIVYKVCSDYGQGPVSWCTSNVPGAPGVSYRIGQKTLPVEGTPLMAFESERLARKFINMRAPVLSSNARLFRSRAIKSDLPRPEYLLGDPRSNLVVIRFWAQVNNGLDPDEHMCFPTGTVLCSEITLVEELVIDYEL